jgi:hypothetical protein
MLKQLIYAMVIRVPNNETSRKGNTGNNSQAFGKVTLHRGQRILWQATIEKPTPSTAPLRPDEL